MQAGLIGLEECPFCEWKCVLEASSEEDKLFRCGNEEGGCGAVSCRGCKKLVCMSFLWFEEKAILTFFLLCERIGSFTKKL